MDINALEVAKRIRDKVADLNDELLLAALAEVDVEFEPVYNINGATKLVVWCGQEI